MFGLTIAILLGLIFGSFGSVLLSRWGESTTREQASSILRWRSECPHCKHRLHSYDLIPLLSFFLQGRKCRYCHKWISRLYPILELWSALIFWLLYFFFADQGLGVYGFWITMGRILRLLLVYDVLRYEVHIPLVILGAAGVGWAVIIGLFPIKILRGAVLFLGFFWIMYIAAKLLVKIKYDIKEEGIWMGDVIIAPYLGALRYAGLPLSMLTIDRILMFLLFLTISGFIGILRYLIQNKIYQKKASFLTKKIADQAVPFLPAMIFGVAVVLIFQQWFLDVFWF